MHFPSSGACIKPRRDTLEKTFFPFHPPPNVVHCLYVFEVYASKAAVETTDHPPPAHEERKYAKGERQKLSAGLPTRALCFCCANPKMAKSDCQQWGSLSEAPLGTIQMPVSEGYERRPAAADDGVYFLVRPGLLLPPTLSRFLKRLCDESGMRGACPLHCHLSVDEARGMSK